MKQEQLDRLKAIVEDKRLQVGRLDVTNDFGLGDITALALEEEADDLAAAIEYIEKLPVTVDGVYAREGMPVYRATRTTGKVEEHRVTLSALAAVDHLHISASLSDGCFSTRSAAEAAARQEGG